MTGEEFLKLSDDEQTDMRELGYEIAKRNNPNAVTELTQAFLDAGMLDDAERVINQQDSAINFMAKTIQDTTGWNATWLDNIWGNKGGWIDGDSGRFLGKFEMGESPDNRYTDDEFKQAIIDKFGMKP